jgi:hypothetical protein
LGSLCQQRSLRVHVFIEGDRGRMKPIRGPFQLLSASGVIGGEHVVTLWGSMSDDFLGLEGVSYSSRVVDEDALKAATDEEAFTFEAFDALKELAQSVAVIAGLDRLDDQGNSRSLTRNEAILAGLVVRCMKLQEGLQSCDPQRIELLHFFERPLTESAVNLRYLLEHGSPELFDSYVRSSLRLDKELHDRITTAVAARGGIVQPIEHRMLEGVEKSFETAGVELDSVDADDRRPWSPRGMYGRFEAVGLAEFYNPSFGSQSHYTHGTWHDLYAYHLSVQPDGGFLPELRWGVVRPWPLLAAIDVLADASTRYLDDLKRPGTGRDTLADRIGFCAQKGRQITQLHEAFVQRGQSFPSS